MSPLNPAFIGCTNFQRAQFNELLNKAKCANIVYPSKHFFERVVERNLAIDIVFAMVGAVVVDFRKHTFNRYTYRVKWKNFSLFAEVNVGTVSGKRIIILKTIYDRDISDDFDVTISI